MKRKIILSTLFLSIVAVVALGGLIATNVNAQAAPGPSEIGVLDPLIPFHVGAIHAGLVWKEGSDQAKILHFQRHSETTGNDVVRSEDVGVDENQTLIDEYIEDPDEFPYLVDEALDGELTFNNTLRDSYKQLLYGGFRLWQGLSQSVPTRMLSDLDRELTQLFDPNHPDAFQADPDAPPNLYVTDITEADSLLNAEAFTDAGFSKGLNYNLYCPGHSMLGDGRMFAAGGHDMNSNAGYKKTNIFDPETESWVERPVPCIRSEWEKDRFGEELFDADPDATQFPACLSFLNTDKTDPNHPTDPAHPSDMKYERWYPSVITLPDGKVLIISGSDQNEQLGPNDPSDPDPTAGDVDFRASKVITAVPEVYDPATDTVTTLENARKLFPVYAKVRVRQTGPGTDDWQVCALGGRDAPAGEAVALPDVPSRDAPANATVRDAAINPVWTGATYCLDVNAALADPNIDVPAENHWEPIGTAQLVHDRGASADILKIGPDGDTEEHTVTVFGGANQARLSSAIVETISFVEEGEIVENPEWQRRGDLLRPADGTHATPLPDGKILVVGGRERGFAPPPGQHVHGGAFQLQYQMFDPDTGTTTGLVVSNVPRAGHANILVMPDATVMIMGDNRHTSDLHSGPRRLDDKYEGGDGDLGVNTARVYRPPYLFNADGSPAQQPTILAAPDAISYGDSFNVQLSEAEADEAQSVVIIRTGISTHALYTDIRLVEVPFDNEENGTLMVEAPSLPAQAIPGDYMLFVVNNDGVPSQAKHVRLGESPELAYFRPS